MENLQNEIVSKAAELAAENVNEAVETKAAEIKEEVAQKQAEFDAKLDKFASTIDKISEKAAGTFAIGQKRTPIQEMNAATKDGLANLKNAGDSFTIKSEDFGMMVKDLTVAAGSATRAGGEAGMSMIEYDPNYQTRLMSFLPNFNIGGNSAFRFNEESALTDNTASKTEGAAGTINVQTVKPAIEPAQTIQSLLTIPNEWLSEIDGSSEYVNRRLMGLLMDEVDDQMIGGNGTAPNLHGLSSSVDTANSLVSAANWDTKLDAADENSIKNANNLDCISVAAAYLEGDNFKPDTVFVNPKTYRLFSVLKDNDGQYVSLSAKAHDQAWAYFGGLRVVPNSAINEDRFLVVDSSRVTTFTSGGINFTYGLNSDDFASNNISARATFRGGIAGINTSGYIWASFSNGRTALASA